MRVAFFDRDGTIIEDYPDEKWSSITAPEFVSNSINTLQKVQEKGYKIIIITNQYLINEGYITLQQYEQINKLMIERLSSQGIKVLDVFYCPHRRDEGCNCIKPRTGMIYKAINKYSNIDINQSFMIGDSKADINLAINLNMKGFGIGVDATDPRIKKLDNLKDLISYI
ncbi:HAD-IIIA family hydrolase [Pontibacillus sp. HMF3514]|nr:HAD-IIIA family hydrolase [Pontibacillus sp. HMF3514]